MNELKKCPFCGGEVEMFTEQLDAVRDCYNFHCESCNMSVYYDYSDKEEAIEKWNTRTPVDKVIERLEERKLVSRCRGIELSCTGGYGKIIDEINFGMHKAYSQAIEIIKEGMC